MFGAYDTAQIRAAEAAAMDGPDDLTLMLRAATGLAVEVAGELRRVSGGVSGRRVLILAGAGNNGGDALFAGAWLARRGVQVSWCPVMDRFHERGATALARAGGRRVALAEVPSGLTRHDVVVDGVLGIGGRAGLPGGLAPLTGALAQARTPVVAVDLPTGLSADAGGAPAGGYLPAALTVTFGGRKLCQVVHPAAAACGRLRLIDIGLDLPAPVLRCWEAGDVAARWPVPGPSSDKYARGVVGVDAGSDAYPGAGVLAVSGAVAAGAGMVRFLGADRVSDLVVRRLPNVVTAAGRVQAAVLGPGWGERPDGLGAVLGWVLGTDVPLVVDADALRYLPAGPLGERVVLTPHAGELARLLGRERAEVEADPVAAVRAAVATTGATVLLKGATQFVAGPGEDTVEVAVPGPAWTGQAGSGDVLAGIVGTLLAAGLTPRDAATAGASVQALAAAAHPGPHPPQRLAARLPGLIAALTAGR
ncbi:bifunctional ADP-dependent NAD(P)H-hydrate dehydratase/NAD(P)H-hydrate epimerase [Propionicicella superfundia]|uniref:bifunctional ADP-dependent NAD(P)H-hydrate dehydratase/NAD(P)H-hydrate epimerase n=1 Tax=Propionicicella superfundia TaxID=348582 RepID=UPI0004127166|nr:bifunctional ADP-dependent NAD(P)H-hydrate dehydratase/NAD(P)H-hydrate epimerase [Propionicicella superfundia]